MWVGGWYVIRQWRDGWLVGGGSELKTKNKSLARVDLCVFLTCWSGLFSLDLHAYSVLSHGSWILLQVCLHASHAILRHGKDLHEIATQKCEHGCWSFWWLAALGWWLHWCCSGVHNRDSGILVPESVPGVLAHYSNISSSPPPYPGNSLWGKLGKPIYSRVHQGSCIQTVITNPNPDRHKSPVHIGMVLV